MFFFKRKPIVQSEMMITVITKACKDELFRKELLDNPKGTIERELNIKIPDDIKIVVQEDTEKIIHLTLPPMPKVTLPDFDTSYNDDRNEDDDKGDPNDYMNQSMPGRFYC